MTAVRVIYQARQQRDQSENWSEWAKAHHKQAEILAHVESLLELDTENG